MERGHRTILFPWSSATRLASVSANWCLPPFDRDPFVFVPFKRGESLESLSREKILQKRVLSNEWIATEKVSQWHLLNRWFNFSNPIGTIGSIHSSIFSSARFKKRDQTSFFPPSILDSLTRLVFTRLRSWYSLQLHVLEVNKFMRLRGGEREETVKIGGGESFWTSFHVRSNISLLSFFLFFK